MRDNFNVYDSIVFNSYNHWWSYQLTFETYFRENYFREKAIWINLAHKNRLKLEGNTSDFLNPLFFKNQENNLLNFKRKYDLNIETSFLDLQKISPYPAFQCIDELKEYKINEFKLGKLVYAQMCGRLQSVEFKIDKNNLYLVEYYLNLGSSTYLKAQEKIKKYSPKKIFIINDRYIAASAAISAAQLFNIEVNVIYWGAGAPHSILFHENSLYDYDIWQNNIFENWKEIQGIISQNELSKTKNEFVQKYSIVSENSKIFLSSTKKGRGIKSFASKLAIFYTSSDWEFSPVVNQKNNNSQYQDQYDAFFKVSAYLSGQGWSIVVKLHPPIKKNKVSTEKNDNFEKIKKIKNAKILEEKTTVDTYALMQQATLNIVWGSSVGLECIARGLPVMIVGNPPWCSPNTKNSVRNNEQLEKFITTGDFIYPVDELIPYLVYIKSFGEKFKYISLKRYIPMFENFEIIKPRFFYRVLSSMYFWLKQ